MGPYLVVCAALVIICAIICISTVYHNLALNKFREDHYEGLYINLRSKLERVHSVSCQDCKKIVYPLAYGTG